MTDDGRHARSRRQLLRAIGTGSSSLMLGVGRAVEPSDAQRESKRDRQGSEPTGEYLGEALTRIEYRDENGDPIDAGAYSSPYEVQVYVLIGTIPERDVTNAFYLQIGPLDEFAGFNKQPELGKFRIQSSAQVENEAFIFWDIDRSITRFRGALVNSYAGTETPLFVNWVNVWVPGQGIVEPVALNENTLLNGWFNYERNEVFIRVDGNTIQRTAPFVIDIHARASL